MSAPVFTVVIPTYNRPAPLLRCLESLTRVDYPAEDYEVVVVNDGGAFTESEDIERLKGSLRLTLASHPHRGPAGARNTGSSVARGRNLAFTDDDCVVAPGWLRALHQVIDLHPTALVGGRTVNALPSNPFADTSQLVNDYLYEYYDGSVAVRPRFFASNNVAVPAAAFVELGGFDDRFPLPAGEDREFCDRWHRSGRQSVYAPRAVIHHQHALTFRRFLRQHFNYGRGAFHFHAHRGQRRATHREPVAFYRRLLTYPLSRRPLLRGALCTALLTAAQGAVLTGYWWERTTGGRAESLAP